MESKNLIEQFKNLSKRVEKCDLKDGGIISEFKDDMGDIVMDEILESFNALKPVIREALSAFANNMDKNNDMYILRYNSKLKNAVAMIVDKGKLSKLDINEDAIKSIDTIDNIIFNAITNFVTNMNK